MKYYLLVVRTVDVLVSQKSVAAATDLDVCGREWEGWIAQSFLGKLPGVYGYGTLASTSMAA